MLDEVDQARLHEDGNALVQLINDGFEPGGAAWRVGGEKNERLDCLPGVHAGRPMRHRPAAGRHRGPLYSHRPGAQAGGPQDGAAGQDQEEASARPGARDPALDAGHAGRSWSRTSSPTSRAGIENDRDEDLWRPLLAIADTIGGEVPALARAAMLELIAVGHEPSVGEELMSAIYDILTAEQIDRPDVTKIALQRLVGLVNAVDGPWTEYRGGMGCDSRWLSKQLKSFDLSGATCETRSTATCRPAATTSSSC